MDTAVLIPEEEQDAVLVRSPDGRLYRLVAGCPSIVEAETERVKNPLLDDVQQSAAQSTTEQPMAIISRHRQPVDTHSWEQPMAVISRHRQPVDTHSWEQPMGVLNRHSILPVPALWEQPMAIINHRRQPVDTHSWEQPVAIINRRRTRH